MYRCVALAAIRIGADPTDAHRASELANAVNIVFDGDRVFLDGDDVTDEIRRPEVTAAAAEISVHPGVRDAMVASQRELIAEGPYVAEGRDIGTVVSPESPLKIFLTASDEERARRRAAQTGEPVGRVLRAQRKRDASDRRRRHGALRLAPDAVEVDTTGQAAADTITAIVSLARDRGLP
jgi:cytidylate kinase